MASIATLKRISSSDLSKLILSQSTVNSPTLAVIDVRDDDHIGGHIRGSQHIPSATLDYKMPELVRKNKDKEIVVFHCALSQQRGPSAALRYMRERERLTGSSQSVGAAMKKSAPENSGRAGENDKNWEDVDGKASTKEQKVYVLDRGFVGWQEVYGTDERLTEAYSKALWKDYDGY